MTTPRKDLPDELAREEARLRNLEELRTRIRARVEVLRERLVDTDRETGHYLQLSIIPDLVASRTPAEKVAFFRRIFRGRMDVFPRLWANPKKGTKGYAPACFNEWIRGACEKPKIKCGECPTQAFIPVDDQGILDHLRGRHVVGVYPLLENETCWFLALDFDKLSWMDDVAAFVETCRTIGLPCSVERSRSGNGAHVWFFFAAPVPASIARKMGCYMITETMAQRSQLSMASYDRLFPNQDTMPRGGFGNLIALPLQQEPRRHGNTVFLDDRFQPHPDQWAYLASIEKLDLARVEAIAREAARQGRVVGVRLAGPEDDVNAAPWMRSPSGSTRASPVTGPLPAEVRAVFSQRLFVEKTGLPSPLLNQVKRLAAFQNPEFYKKQGLRLSTALTPRVIACAEEFPQHVALPRGCTSDLESLLREHGIRLVIEDQRNEGEPLELSFHGELTALQEEAARALLDHDIGVLVAPPGVGKSVLGTYLVSQRGRNTLVLVHRRPLLDQWVTQLSMFLGIDEKDIGQVGGGKRTANRRLDVAMIQSLFDRGNVDDIVTSYGHVIVDECHHLPAVSFERVLSEVKARYIVGLTATPSRRDGHHPIAEMQLGPIRFAVDPKSHAASRPFEHRLIVRDTNFRMGSAESESTIQEIYRRLAEDSARNRLILDDVIRLLEEGRSPILLTERKDHLEVLAGKLRGFVRHLVVLQGGMTERERRDLASELSRIPDEQERLVLATGRYLGEGFDDARLDTLFLAMPISWKGTLVQYSGRLHRLHPRKAEVRIYDYVDREVPMLLRMFEKRLRTYRAVGYARGQAPLDDDESNDKPTVEYDPEAIRYFEEVDRQ